MDEKNNKSNKEVHIWVDADACPVVRIVEKIAEKYIIPVTLLCDTNHVLESQYSEVIVVGAGADAVDYKLISICHNPDSFDLVEWVLFDSHTEEIYEAAVDKTV